MKYINLKFILIATISYIPFTVLWFFWHNNLFPHIYYSVNSTGINSINDQNIWMMNFANALLLYGMVYFFFKGIKPETTIIKPVFWGIYYNLSVLGFFNFMILGFFNVWSWERLVYDLIFAVISGAIFGAVIFKVYRWIYKPVS